jgi:hypothetical protein
MTIITFEKYIVTCNEGLTVEIDQQGIADDTLELATDWKYGMGLADKDDFAAKQTGFIGSGFNKIAIYVSYFASSPFRCLTVVIARPDIVMRNMLLPALLKIRLIPPVSSTSISQRSSSFSPWRTP